jgi:hypothetical protein
VGPEGSLPRSQQSATCPYPEPAQCSPFPHSTPWKSILILSSHLYLGLRSGLLPSGLPTEILYAPLLSPYMLHALPISILSIWSPGLSGLRTQIHFVQNHRFCRCDYIKRFTRFYSSAEISHWNRLMTSTLGFRKKKLRKSQMDSKTIRLDPIIQNEWVTAHYNIVFKIKHKLYIASGPPPPPSEKIWVRTWRQMPSYRITSRVYVEFKVREVTVTCLDRGSPLSAFGEMKIPDKEPLSQLSLYRLQTWNPLQQLALFITSGVLAYLAKNS